MEDLPRPYQREGALTEKKNMSLCLYVLKNNNEENMSFCLYSE